MTDTGSNMERRFHGSLWGAFDALVENGRLVGTEAFGRDEAPSPLIRSIPDAVYSEARIDRPYVRAGWFEGGAGRRRERRGGEPFVAVSWERALDLVAGELERVRRQHGNQAIYAGSYGWASMGRLHRANSQLHRFLNCFGGFTASVQSYSVAAAMTIVPHVLGTFGGILGNMTTWDGIVSDTRLMVAFGGLPLRNDQVGTAGAAVHELEPWLRRAVEAGVEFVNISPARDDMPDFVGAQWLAPRPNTDTALMLGLAHTLAVEKLHDRSFLRRYCTGYETFERYLLGADDGEAKDADWAAAITGIAADKIRTLARRMASHRTMLTAAYSLQRGEHGEQPYWMLITLAAMLGQIGLPGGGFGLGYGSIAGTGMPRGPMVVPRLPLGKNETVSFIPVARIADMLLDPGGTYDYNGERRTFPDIRMVYWAGGNPFHHHQDLNRLIEAWRRPDTIVVHEPWWTATARHADIVLPATTTLERNDIGVGERDRFVIAMHKAIDPVGQARNDYDIFTGLAGRLGIAEAYTEGRDEMAWICHLYDIARQQAARHDLTWPDFETFWSDGYVEVPLPKAPTVLLADYRQDPGTHALKTPSGRIEIASDTVAGFGYDDCPGHPTWLEPAEWLGGKRTESYPLHMLSSQPRTRLHSQLDQGRVSRMDKIDGREPVYISTEDASLRGIADGDLVRIFNDRGEVLAGARLTDGLRPGVVCLPTGAWFDPIEPGQIGSLDKHGNPNVLTRDVGTSRLAQGPSAQSVLVEIEKHMGEAPALTAFAPPMRVARQGPGDD
jgi:biotin/methionine sulfoxide reductase